jgi:hypothetical protein
MYCFLTFAFRCNLYLYSTTNFTPLLTTLTPLRTRTAYTSAVESLWLEGNKLERIQNLEALTQLRCLNLNNNVLSRVEGVAQLSRLTMLNLSSNRITRLAGLEALKSLSNLLVTDNQLRTKEDIAHLEGEGVGGGWVMCVFFGCVVVCLPRLSCACLISSHLVCGFQPLCGIELSSCVVSVCMMSLLRDCHSVQELDLGGNLIDDVAAVEVLEAMPELRILILEKNPVPDYNGRTAATSTVVIVAATPTVTAAAATTMMTTTAAVDVCDGPAVEDETEAESEDEDDGVVVMTTGGGAWGEASYEAPSTHEDQDQNQENVEEKDSTSPPPPSSHYTPTALPNYRRALVARLSQLHALDHRPVNPQERKYCEQWWLDLNQQQGGGAGGGFGQGGAAAGTSSPGAGAGAGAGVGADGFHHGVGGGDSGSAPGFPEGNEWPVWVLHEVYTRGGLSTMEVTHCAECSSVGGCASESRWPIV